MTLNLLTQVPEGLVMLTDSVVSSQRSINGEVERISFQHARKLFHLGQNSPAAAMLNGDANIGTSLVSQLLRDASGDIDAHKGVVDHDVSLEAVSGRISPVYDSYVSDVRKQLANEIGSDPAALAKINEARKTNDQPPLSAITADMIAVSGILQEGPSVTEITPPQLMVIVGSYFASPLASLLTWPGAGRRDIITQTS